MPTTEKLLKLNTVFLGLIVLFLACVVLKLLQTILVPFFIALFIVYLFEPAQRLMLKWRLPATVRIVLILLASALLLYLIGQMLYSSTSSLSKNLPLYEVRLTNLMRQVLGIFNVPMSEVQQLTENFQWKEKLQSGKVAALVGKGLGSFVGFIGNLTMVLFYMIYFLYERESFVNRVRKSFPQERSEHILHVVHDINLQMANYLEMKVLISLATGVAVTVVLLIFGVNFAILWGLLAFLLNFIPNIGSVLSAIPPILLAFVENDSLLIPSAVVASLLTIHFITGSIIEPKLMGSRMDLSPLVVIFALIFWGWLWGAVGMILSIPIVVVIRIICKNIETLRPISYLLAEESNS